MSRERGRAPRRVVLHVGAPKSGTTFLQRGLWANRDGLRAAGIICPGERQRAMFLAAIEVREGHVFWGYPPEEIDGTWAALCEQARAHQGTTVMSHELLGAATPEQIERALAELEGLEVHVVLTARDLARQVTSEWQERVKNGSTKPFSRFQRRVLRQIADGDFSTGFWRNQDPVEVLARWAGHLPPSQVHVVVAPPAGAEPLELWRRFGAAVGFDGDAFDPLAQGGDDDEPHPTNQALGVAQIAVLREVNKALDGRIVQPAYARVVKERFAEQLLAGQGGRRPQAPQVLTQELRQVAEQRNEALAAAGYLVHGDLAELIPAGTGSRRSPDKVSRKDAHAAYARVVADLLVQRADERQDSRLRRAAKSQAAAPLRRRLAQRLRG